MPKLENFDNYLEIDGVAFGRNELKAIDSGGDLVTVKYNKSSDVMSRAVSTDTFNIPYSDWTDSTDTPYASKSAFLTEANSFFFDNVASGGGNTNQELWDEISTLADFGMSAFETSSGEGGAYDDMTQTVKSTNNSNVQSFKGFGNNMPNVTNFLAIRALDPSTNEIWYKDEGGYPVLRTDTNEGLGYLRIHNGNGLEYETGAGSISPSITAPYSQFICMRVYPGALNERTGFWKERNNSDIAFVQTNPEIQTTFSIERFKWIKLLFEIDGSGNWQFYHNGVVIDSGVGGTLNSINELLIGANGHPIEHHFAFQLDKFGLWTDQEKAKLYAYTDLMYPFEFPTQPYYDTINTLTSQQWNTSTKEWDLYRNKTVVFGGGNGVEGTPSYQWYYYDDANPNPFPETDKLDYHLPFEGVDGQGSTLNRNHYIAGNGRGNATIFNNPASAPFIRLMCVITPRDSTGLEGEKIVSSWTVDNIA